MKLPLLGFVGRDDCTIGGGLVATGGISARGLYGVKNTKLEHIFLFHLLSLTT